MKRLIIVACLMSMLVCETMAGNYPKVILRGDYPDPSVLRDGDDYYMTHSPFYYMPGFLIWHSRDLLNWQPVGRAMAEWEGSAMAPDLVKVGNTYYIYYPAAGTNWVITAEDIRGPWTKPVDLKIKGIDPGHIVTPEGERYLFTSEGYVTKLTADGLARDGESRKVYDGWQYPQDWVTECMCLESPKLTWHNGYYYLTSAEGGTAGPATSHMVVVARSKSLFGPWENSPYNPIVHTWSDAEPWWSKGHGTLVEGKDGQWWIVYHAYEKGSHALGRQTLIEPIEWTKGGWYRPVPDYTDNLQIRRETDLNDDFSGAQIKWQWTGWKENIATVASQTKGVLTLPGKGTSPKDGRLMLTTAEDTTYAVSVEVMVDKQDTEAGLLLYYSEKGYAGLVSDGRQLWVYGDGNTPYAERRPTAIQMPKGISARHFFVREENHLGQVKMLLSADGKAWEDTGIRLNVSEMHHNNLFGFYALRPALYVAGKGMTRFKGFQYQHAD